MSKQYTKLYVLMLDGVILTPDSFQEYWKNYGTTGSSLYGWRPPKKIYYTLGHARNGLRFVPEQIRDKVQIHVFESAGEATLSITNKQLMQHILCPKCSKGTMIKEIEKVYLTNPVKYKYVCNTCNHIDYRFD